MAARLAPTNGRAWTPDKVRQRIRVALLSKRLQDHALGKLEMTDSQRKATEILLKKTLPDLQSIDATLRGDEKAPIALTIVDGNL